MEYKEELRRVLYQFRDLWCQNIDLETIDEFIEQEVANKNFVLSGVIGSLPTSPRYCMECGSRIIKEELYCEYCRRQ